MSFSYKLKFYQTEENEFTEELACNQTRIESLVEEYWNSTGFPNGLELIVINNTAGETLVLEHFGKDVFECYFLPVQQNYHYHKMTRIEIVYNGLSAFFNNNRNWLETGLNKTKKYNRRIRESIRSDKFRLEVTSERLWSEILMLLILGIPMGLFFMVSAVVMLFKAPAHIALYLIEIFIAFIGVYSWIPGIMLHHYYELDNEHLVVIISRGKDEIAVEHYGQQKTLLKSDIEQITRFTTFWHRFAWSEYGFIEIRFKSGEVINLTNLMMDQFLIYQKFPGYSIRRATTSYPGLRENTWIDFQTPTPGA